MLLFLLCDMYCMSGTVSFDFFFFSTTESNSCCAYISKGILFSPDQGRYGMVAGNVY